MEPGDDFLEDALRELKEEGGYSIDKERMEYLGETYGAKSSDTVYHYFAADVTGMEQQKAEGDGSKLETLAHCEWVRDIGISRDPLSYVCFYKLIRHLHGQTKG